VVLTWTTRWGVSFSWAFAAAAAAAAVAAAAILIPLGRVVDLRCPNGLTHHTAGRLSTEIGIEKGRTLRL